VSKLRWNTEWVVAVAATVWAGGCGREAPPEIQEYVPLPSAKAAPATQPAEPEAVVDAHPQEAPPAAQPVPEAPPPVVTRVETAVAPAAPAAPAGAKAPTIVGTWRVVEMLHEGRAQPMPPGMTMQLTFGEDGTFAVAMPGMPEERAQQGTYTLNGDQISISVRGEAKTGTRRFEGSNRATLEIDEGKMPLERS